MTTSQENPYGVNAFDAIAKHQNSLWWAADTLISALTADQIAHLKIRAGEHLAAMLTTCFLGSAPTALDDAGGVDLVFAGTASDQRGLSVWLESGPMVYETKSVPGPFRAAESKINRVIEAGGDPSGMGVTVTVRTANAILQSEPTTMLLRKAESGLASKVDPAIFSLNAFLVVHPFDAFAVELADRIILGPSLAPLQGFDKLASIWVLWMPGHLTVWSKRTQTWVNLIFTVNHDEENHELDDFGTALQQAERYFLDRIGYALPSPFTFTVESKTI